MTRPMPRQGACQKLLVFGPNQHTAGHRRRGFGALFALCVMVGVGGTLVLSEAQAADGAPSVSSEAGNTAQGSGVPKGDAGRKPAAGDKAAPQRGGPERRQRPRGCPYRDKPLNLMV
ncbi:MAG: hypothetical protein RIC14_01620 [Filomicrobium sp.]